MAAVARCTLVSVAKELKRGALLAPNGRRCESQTVDTRAPASEHPASVNLMKRLLIVVLIAAFAAFAWRLLPSPHGTGGSSQVATGRGVIQHVDPAAGEVTIKHGPLPALNMMAMTMSYRVKDRSRLVNLQPKQEVEFTVGYDGREYVITEIK
ncbi:copper-binding protein [Betaproteobacteria bacterium PRO7]|nr:copper-binding protein [Betaproteobacteria bacterium PRO7]